MILIFLNIIQLDGRVTSNKVLSDCDNAVFHVLSDTIHYDKWVCREHLNTIEAEGDVAALYLGTVSSVYSHTKAVDVINFGTEQNLLSVLTLEINAYKCSFSDLAVLNDGRLFCVCNGKDSAALKVGETGAGHHHIITVDENATRCHIMLVSHEFAVDDIDLSTR